MTKTNNNTEIRMRISQLATQLRALKQEITLPNRNEKPNPNRSTGRTPNFGTQSPRSAGISISNDVVNAKIIKSPSLTLKPTLPRIEREKGDWMLNPTISEQIFATWGQPKIDLFASNANKQATYYYRKNGTPYLVRVVSAMTLLTFHGTGTRFSTRTRHGS